MRTGTISSIIKELRVPIKNATTCMVDGWTPNIFVIIDLTTTKLDGCDTKLYFRLTLDAKFPYIVSGFQLGATVEVGTDCLYASDFNNDVSQCSNLFYLSW